MKKTSLTPIFHDELQHAFEEQHTPASGVSAIIGTGPLPDENDALYSQPLKLVPSDFDVCSQQTDKLRAVPINQTKGSNTLTRLNADVHYSGIMLMTMINEEDRHGLFQVIVCTQIQRNNTYFVHCTLFDPVIGLFDRELPWWQHFDLWLGQP